MLRWHRLSAILAGVLLAWVLAMGLGIQLADMRALLTHAPATDPDMLMQRQHIYGPDNYSVVSAPDYAAAPLPAGVDYPAVIAHTAALGRAAAPGQPLRLVELRSAQGKVAGHVQMGTEHLIFELASGARLPAADLPPPPPDNKVSAPRSSFKYLHRFQFIGTYWPFLMTIVSVGMAVLVGTGLLHYLKLYRIRARAGRRQAFWKGGDWWRRLHRWTALAASVLVIWVTVTGLALSLDSVGSIVHQALNGKRAPGALSGDQSSPMADGELAGMTRTTLAAFAKAEPDTGIKVLRLRYFAGYPQGAIVAADADTSQHIFNGHTGARMRMWEKGYPDLSFPTGWEYHQKLKQLHRGDLFGLTGRWLQLAGGVSLLYLAVSGLYMYYQLWSRRRKAGRGALVWT